MHSSLAVANKLLKLAESSGKSLTPMQVLKLVYMCHGWMLGLYGRPLISDKVEAWQYGPVIPNLYHSLKSYRASPVTNTLMQPVDEAEFGEEEESLISQVFNIYGDYSGPQLSTITHRAGSPWHAIWNSNGSTISNDLIQTHYEELAQRGK